MRYFLDISFRGARYHGWQIQPGDITVQEEVQKALSLLLGKETAVTGAGRTDAGVNALHMPAHFDSDIELDADRRRNLCRSLCAICRPDITVNACVPVSPDAHARFDAVLRTYRYFVNTRPDPFVYPLSWMSAGSLDFEAMNREARELLGTHDFTSFSKLHTDVRTNICTVSRAEWHRIDGDRWYFEISADRFLRNMVRAVVGTLIDVGKGKAGEGHIRTVMSKMDRCGAGTSMPAHALFLWDVEYPYPLWTNNQTELL